MAKKSRVRKKADEQPQGQKYSLRKWAIWAVVAAIGGAGVWAVQDRDPVDAAPGEIVVYKSPTCGCCKEWVAHLRDFGFKVSVNDKGDMDPVKAKYKVPYEMESCHTAVVDGYVLEGHVPALDIRRLLEKKPNVTGIAVPGMPIGSPGMEQGGQREPYKVLTFGGSGVRTFAQY